MRKAKLIDISGIVYHGKIIAGGRKGNKLTLVFEMESSKGNSINAESVRNSLKIK